LESSANQENTPAPAPLEDKMVVDSETDPKPLKIINFQNLKQQTLLSYFKKL